MRILQTHNFYQQSGGEDRVFAEETELLKEKGHFVMAHSVHNDDVAGLGKKDLLKKTFWNQKSHDDISKIVIDNRIDILHSHNTLPLLSPSIYYAARENGAAVVQTLHNYRLYCPSGLFFRDGKVCEDCLGKSLATPGIRHACYRSSRATTAVVAKMVQSHRKKKTWSEQVDLYLSLTEFAKSRFVEGGMKGQQIRVKPNFVGTDYGQGDGSGGYCLFVGRLSEEKGVRTLIETWESGGIDAPLWVIGTGPLVSFVEEKAKTNPAIVYRGFLDPSEVIGSMQNARATLVTSEWYETFGRVVTESFSVGTPVVASRIGALSELLKDGETGFSFEAGNSEDLRAKIRQVYSLSPEETITMRKKARAEYERRYTPDKNYEMLIAAYEEARQNYSSKG